MPLALLVRLFLWIWFGAAIMAGHQLMLQRLPPFGVQAVVFGLTALVLLAYFKITPLYNWINALDIRSLMLLHLTRFVGIYFLMLFQQGRLPREFAVPAGLGDIIVATMVLPVAFAPVEPRLRLRAIGLWNIVGLADMLLVIITITRLNLTRPGQLDAFTRLPLSLLPTFLVPLIIATHVIIYVRLRRMQSGT
jgi:hypothetical protein